MILRGKLIYGLCHKERTTCGNCKESQNWFYFSFENSNFIHFEKIKFHVRTSAFRFSRLIYDIWNGCIVRSMKLENQCIVFIQNVYFLCTWKTNVNVCVCSGKDAYKWVESNSLLISKDQTNFSSFFFILFHFISNYLEKKMKKTFVQTLNLSWMLVYSHFIRHHWMQP